MKLLHAGNITTTTRYETKDVRRGDLFNWVTGEYPPDVGDGDPDDVVARIYYDGTETLEIENATTDGTDISPLIHEDNEYHVLEMRQETHGWLHIAAE